MGAEIGLGVLAIKTGSEIYGQIASASAKEDAARRNALLKEQESEELLYRQFQNEQIVRENADNQVELAYAQAGMQGGASRGIAEAIEINRITTRNILMSRHEAEYKARMLKQGAEVESQLASDAMSASYITSAGTLLTGAGQGYLDYTKYSKQGDNPNLQNGIAKGWPNG